MDKKDRPGLGSGKVPNNIVQFPIPQPSQAVKSKLPKEIPRTVSEMDKEMTERWNRINRATCYDFAGRAVIYSLGEIGFEQMILMPDNLEIAGGITQVDKSISSPLKNRNDEELWVRDKVEKIVRGMMVGKIAEARFWDRFEKDRSSEWLEEVMDEENGENVKDYFSILSPRENDEEIWAYAGLLSVQAEILVDENWGTIKKVAQAVYRKHQVSRV